MTGKRGLAVCLAGMMVCLASGCSVRMPWVSAAGETREEVKETAANRLEAIKQLGELRIGISADYAPFAFETEAGKENFPMGEQILSLADTLQKSWG